MRATRSPLLLAAALSLAVTAVACSGDDAPLAGPTDTRGGPSTTEEPRLDIDPRSYYENYEESQEERGVGAPAPSSGVAGGAADAGAGGSNQTETAAPDVAPVPPAPREPGIHEDNTFTDPGANPFVTTTDDAESTFALDVDTGSYTVGRRFLDEGSLPPPDSVRTEEWVNAFGYGDPTPDEGDLGVTVSGAPSPFAEDGTQLLRFGVRSRDVAAEERPPAHLTFVVDTSGSMDIRERLGLVRSTLALLALELRDDDTVSVVTYGASSNVVLPPTPAAEAQTIVDSIDELTPGGSTNMEAGLRAGYEQARAGFDPEAINTVILASDGVANVGVTGTDPLTDMIRTEGDDGIRLVTVGYGMGNYNDELMEQLADRGDGFYSYVDTYEEAERLFTRELTSTLTVVAEDTRAQVRFDPAAVESYRLLGYENRDIADEDFEDDSVDAGELGAGHAVTALYEVRPVDGGPDRLGTVALRHQPPGGGDAVETEVPVAAGNVASSFAEADPDLRLAGTVAAVAEVVGEHPVATRRGITLDDIAGLVPEGGEGPGTEVTGRPDAAALAEVVDLARNATPPPPDDGGEEPVPLPRPTPTPTPTPG